MIVSLYTSRIVLNTLGVEDYGINNVVGGIVVMFSAVNTTMATSVQRFMNFEIGKRNTKKLNAIFNTSIIIHIGIALLVLILVESVGVWFLNFKMNIPHERLNAANWVLQFSTFSFMVNVLNVPFNATIIANEKMKIFALVGILEVVLKLLIVFLLTWFSYDKLKLYAVLLFVVSVIIQLVNMVYSKRNFKECDFHWHWDKSLFKEMVSFAGWNMIGVTSTLVRTQGVNIVLNLFYGVVINAAMGIANQVKNAMDSFVNNFMTALNPQIVKSYASSDKEYLMKLVFRGSRYSFYLLLFVSLPIILETRYVLTLWLKNVPDYAVVFVRLILILVMVESLSKTLIQSMFATGDIKLYQIVVGSVTLMNLPLSILFLYFGYAPQVVLIIAIGIAIVSLFIRLFMLEKMISLNVFSFFKEVLSNVFIVGSTSIILPLTFIFFIKPGLSRFIIVSCICIVSVAVAVYLIGLSKEETKYINKRLSIFLKLKH